MANEQTHNTYLPGYTEVEHHKLRTAENCSAYLLPTLRSAYAIKPNLRFLDVGAGSGTITTSLARYMPKGTVIAFDLSADILSQAAAHAKTEGVTNIEFQTGSVYALPFDDDSFDIVHTHQMLCHLDTPLAALTEMLRVCRPGGTVAIRECDMRMWSFWPQLPALEKFLDIQLVTHEAGGGTNVAGPQLISWALKCGVPRERVKASMGTWCYSEGWERRVWGDSWAKRIRRGEVGKKALAMGLATEEELEAMAIAWEEWADAEDGCYASMHGEVLITK